MRSKLSKGKGMKYRGGSGVMPVRKEDNIKDYLVPQFLTPSSKSVGYSSKFVIPKKLLFFNEDEMVPK